MFRLAVLALLGAGAAWHADPARAAPTKRSANAERPTLLLPGAWSVMRADQRREEEIIRREAEAFMGKVKRDSLLLLRVERDRAVARAIAAAAASRPLWTPDKPSISLVDRNIELPPGEAETSPVESAPASPGFLSRVVDHTAEAAQEVVTQSGNAAASVQRQASAHPSPGGFYALVLIALFLVPSMGLASIFWGIVHLRHGSFFPGSVWIAVGVGMLWLAFSGARMLVPTASEHSSPSTLAAP